MCETMSFDRRNVAGNEDLIKRLFNKVYSAILSEKIFCPPETAVYLAAYACQAKFGPAQGLRVPVPPVKELLPKSTIDNHNLSITDWEERISKWHLKLRDTSFLDAIVEYLDIAQDVELYGASIFEVETKNKGRQWISLDAVGLNIYESKKKPPTKRYIWSDIASFNAWDNQIEIVLVHEPQKVITFFVSNTQTCSLLESLFLGSRELYARRRKGDVSSKYIRRSESNSSMRMRPHKLSPMELAKLEQQITELELELPRRATNYEYASWQVKDQLRQARGIEVKLSLNVPSTDETRLLQHRVAQIRVFLEQDFFKEKEPTDRPHRYRGNFAIRIGGTLTSRSDDYSSDIDSGSERNTDRKTIRLFANGSDNSETHFPARLSTCIHSSYISGRVAPIESKQDDQVKTTPSQPRQQPQPQSSAVQNQAANSATSSSETEGHGYVEHPYPSGHKQQSDALNSTMPELPKPLLPNPSGQLKASSDDAPMKPATYNPEAYPKFPGLRLITMLMLPQFTNTCKGLFFLVKLHQRMSFTICKFLDRPMNPSAPIQEPQAPTVSIPDKSGYADTRGSQEMDPPGSVTSPNVWKHVLRTPEQDPSNQFARGTSTLICSRIHGQLVEPDDVQLAYRPPVQPKPKVAPRGTADPRMVVPDYYSGAESSRNSSQDPKFSTLKIIQSGYTKKRVDLFEAL
ncbi:unnamed protein product [Hydatigera taeniaeformis]|uniref:FERM domain-containing protein n=1 Tax=Hydatigena taeniaeformis TaxID=6205 RepID=A0A3P7F9F0_HYDTA|nr:unnamed protein product [Hydatigera taeniaeformis]